MVSVGRHDLAHSDFLVVGGGGGRSTSVVKITGPEAPAPKSAVIA